MATSRAPKAKARGGREKGAAEATAQTKAGKGRNKSGVARETQAAGKSKSTEEKPTVPGQEQAVVTVAEGTVVIEGSARASSENAEGESREVRKISRQALIERAFQKLKERLDSNDDMSPAMIGALEKLLKMDRDSLEETEMPQEIRVLWEETDEDPTDQ